MFRSLHSRAGLGVGVGATGTLALLFTLGISAPAAQANGAAPGRSEITSSCPMERIGTQHVRCDNLSGAGVAARPAVPRWQASAPLSSAPILPSTLAPAMLQQCMNLGLF